MGSHTHRASKGSGRHLPASRAAALKKTTNILGFQNQRTIRSVQVVNHPMVDSKGISQMDKAASVSYADPGSSLDLRIRTFCSGEPLDTTTKNSKATDHMSKPPKNSPVLSLVGKGQHQQKVLPLLLPRLLPRNTAAKLTVTARQPSILKSKTFNTASRIRSSTVTNGSWTTSTGETSDSSAFVLGFDAMDRQQQAFTSLPETVSNIVAPATPASIANPVKETLLTSTLSATLLGKRASASTNVLDSPESHSKHGDLPLNVRNKKMKPTDCLLFAATLLEDAASVLPMARQQAPVSNTEKFDVQHPSPIEDQPDPATPREMDVLCGRGGLINKHPGNQIYRRVVEYNKAFYSSVHKKHRILVSQSIVQSMLNFGCRFLTSGANDTRSWIEIDIKKAVQKTSQALREKPITLDGDERDDEYDMRLTTETLQEDTCTSVNSQYVDFGNMRLMKGISRYEERSRMDKDIHVG
jgi:hypothetical protein